MVTSVWIPSMRQKLDFICLVLMLMERLPRTSKELGFGPLQMIRIWVQEELCCILTM